MANLPPSHAAQGTALEVDIRSQHALATVGFVAVLEAAGVALWGSNGQTDQRVPTALLVHSSPSIKLWGQ